MQNELKQPQSLIGLLKFLKGLIWFLIPIGVLTYLATVYVKSHDYPPLPLLDTAAVVFRSLIWIIFAIFLLLRFVGKPLLARREAPAIQTWAKEKYGIEFDNKEARKLADEGIQDKKEANGSIGYIAGPVNRWGTNPNGMKYQENIFLINLEGEMILFESNSQSELLTVESLEEIELFNTLYKEAREAEGLYVYCNPNVDMDEENPKVSNLLYNFSQPNHLRKKYLFWSDELRANLFYNSAGIEGDLALIPFGTFFEYVLPLMMAEDALVVMNAEGRNDKVFSATEIHEIMVGE